MRLSDIRMKPKLIGLFLLVGLLPLLAAAGLGAYMASEMILEASYNHLLANREIKKGQIEGYFAQREKDMRVLVRAVDGFTDAAFAKGSAINKGKIDRLESYFSGLTKGLLGAQENPALVAALAEPGAAIRHQGTLQELNADNGWKDAYLITPTGTIPMTANKGKELGGNLAVPPLAGTALARAYQRAKEVAANPSLPHDQQIVVEDFSPYPLQEMEQSVFMLIPLREESGRLAGYLGIRLGKEEINRIVQNREGLGQSGESYLVGRKADGSTFYRSDRVVKKGVFGEPKKDALIERALGGESGATLKKGSTGELEVASFAPVNLPGLSWALATTQSAEEALAPLQEGEEKDFYAGYTTGYGYYDLFLISPKGLVFYSVTHEADYQSNLISGEYRDSNLGRLVRQVMETKRFGFADFAPYTPSKGEPAAFIAAPLLSPKGEVELVVALQLPLEGINAVMQQRTGMGRTGETYLVGPGKRMRSDSFLDPQGHSVKASFAGTVEKNGVDTEASRAALAGQADERVIIDYNGNPVLSAFTPIQVFDTRWALLAEIDEAEVKEDIHTLLVNDAIEVVVVAAVVVGVALWLAGSIATPLTQGVELAKSLAAGNLTARMSADRKDEIGDLAGALNGMAEALNRMVLEIMARARRLDQASGQLKEVAGGMTDGAAGLSQQASQVAAAGEEMSATVETIAAAAQQMAANMGTVSAAAEEMATNMNTISAAAEEANTNLNTVAAAAEEASVSMTHVQEAASRTSGNVNTVASAVEEMNASLGEVRTRCQAAATEAAQASGSAKSTYAVMEKLAVSAQEIGKVVEMINNIADQTNMLALNASIEAAGAGEAGKGFAVVANEVKELARQTGEATRLIANQIGAIQANARNAGDATHQVTDIINRLSTANADILRAVEDQGRALGEIARSMGDASRETDEVTGRVGEATRGIEEVARNVMEISSGIGEVTRNVVEASSGVGEMTRRVSETSSGAEEVTRNVTSTSAAVRQVAESMGQVNRSAERIQELSGTVDQRSREMAAIATELNDQLATFQTG